MIVFVRNLVYALLVLVLPVALIAMLANVQNDSLAQLVLLGTVLFVSAYLIRKEKKKTS